MSPMNRLTCFATLVGLVAVNGAYAQTNSGSAVFQNISITGDPAINSDIIHNRVFNGYPSATLTTVNNYPSLVSFSESNVVGPIPPNANRDDWRFSSDGGLTDHLFQNNEYWSISASVTLTGTPITPRKEAGLRLDSNIGGDGLFILDTDAHEIVAFGGALPFYSFGNTFNSGDTVLMGMTYENVGGVNGIVYSANGVNSPFLPMTNTELGVIDGSTLGGYFQIAGVPEPSVFALLGLGALALVSRRRR